MAEKNKTVTVYGQSDDLIEVEGALNEEFGHFGADDGDGEPAYLAFSDGTVLAVRYGAKGCWEVRREIEGSAEYQHVPHDGDETTYTDRVTLTGDLRWVVFGKELVRGKSDAARRAHERARDPRAVGGGAQARQRGV